MKKILAAAALAAPLMWPTAASAMNTAPDAAAACSATVGGTVTTGNAGHYTAHATYDNCTTWRAYARCRQTGTTNGSTRYGSWRSTVGPTSTAGCLNGWEIIAAGWEDSEGTLFGQWP